MEQGFLIKTTCVVLTLTIFIYCTNANTELMKRKLSGRVVSTKFGKLRGLLIEMPDDYLPPVDAYLGLQYASVLGKELRFLPPTSPMEQWSGIRVAISHRPVCPQTIPDLNDLREKMPKSRVDHFERIIPFLRDQQEDCLSLNIYVPVEGFNVTRPTAGFPVVVFVHGEAYDVGTGNAYDGSVLASYGHVIVVTLNYRLGLLGFMSTGDHYAPGNYALMDIVAALQWLKENAMAFGGDRASVTLMGQGYGAAIVNLLMLTPVTAGGVLFKRGIMMSGSALASWSLTEHPRFYIKQLAELVNCSLYIEDSPKLIGCIRDKDADRLVNASTFIRAPKYLSTFAPVILASSVLPDSPEKLILKNSQNDYQVLIGVMKNEGMVYLNERQIEQGLTSLEEQQTYRTLVNNIYKFHRQRIYDVIKHHYTTWEREATNETIRDGVMDMLGDSQFVTPSIDLAKRFARYADTYFYTLAPPSHAPDTKLSAMHGEELAYVFGAPLASGVQPFPSTYTRADRMIGETVMRYWTNFIKTGDPNLPIAQPSWHSSVRAKNKYANILFPKYNLKYLPYIHLGQRPDVRQRYRARQEALWLDLIPRIHQPDYPTPGGVEHYLDEHQNTSLFLKDTRDVDLYMILPPPPRTTPQPTQEPRAPQTRGDSRKATIAPWLYEIKTEKPTASAGNVLSADSPVALGIIVVVGAALLFLNVLVFAIVYYQRDKRRTKHDERNNQNEDIDLQRTSELDEQGHLSGCPERPISPARDSNHVSTTSQIKQNSHLLPQNNGGVMHAGSMQRNYDATGKHAKFSATIWTYCPESDRKEPVTVV